ncbi:MAG TPA: DUF3662 and FHA domain-containing protein [Thermoleophilaceae bacterium]|nr:DUF3662 and FHA domain-containing protein [Thermoleophilaceae bacterium]
MSVLRNLEAKLEGLVEGAFSRAFKSQVQPVEIAHKLVKEMEDRKTVSVSRTYVPNHYRVFLSPKDRAQFEGYEDALRKELSDYVLEHARAEGLALVSRPQVELETDERLALGEFGIQAQLVDLHDDEEPSGGDFGHTMVYSPDREARPLISPDSARAVLSGAGRRLVLGGEAMVVGRSRDCDIRVDDPNVSRRHAELRRTPEGWTLVDLGSTNGTKLNGRRVDEAPLSPGDDVMFGLTRYTFELEP